MSEIRILPEWQKIRKKHENRVAELQVVADKLTQSGITVTEGVIADLVNNGSDTYSQARQAANAGVGIFKLPAARKRAFEEYVSELNAVISVAKQDVVRILAINSLSPFMPDAYIVKKGVVSISDDWIKTTEAEYTIVDTKKQEEARRFVEEIGKAIDSLNNLVNGNRYVNKGVTVWNDGSSCLCYIDEWGVFRVEEHNFQYI